jgi:hypothetical protein
VLQIFVNLCRDSNLENFFDFKSKRLLQIKGNTWK